MNVFDIVYYVLDAVLIGMLTRWLKNSHEVKIETQVSMKWAVSMIFVIVAAVCAFFYEGVFRIVQTAVFLLAAVLYYMQKSGLSDKGIVNMGSLTKYEKAGKVNVNKAQNSIGFRNGNRTAVLYFAPDQMNDVRAFITEKTSVRKQQSL